MESLKPLTKGAAKAFQMFSRRSNAAPVAAAPPPRIRAPRPAPESEHPYEPAEASPLAADPLAQCLQLGRYGYILANKPRWQDQSGLEETCRSALCRIDELFSIVPEGFASLPQTAGDEPGGPEITLATEPFLLARCCVTNREYQRFVDAAGYEHLELWPEDIWPHLIDFKDQTGHTGPRYWRTGRYNKRLADHPVVGICQYEAMAYAAWTGFRLPTEGEWQMAATWRIRSAANTLRRFPWGDALDVKRCNIWASGIGATVPVQEYAAGSSPNQIFQLVGNVWEWSANDFILGDESGGMVVGDMRMAPIRGGAFDTYFSSQASGLFRTGLVCLARAHNVGFRCAIDFNYAGSNPN